MTAVVQIPRTATRDDGWSSSRAVSASRVDSAPRHPGRLTTSPPAPVSRRTRSLQRTHSALAAHAPSHPIDRPRRIPRRIARARAERREGHADRARRRNPYRAARSRVRRTRRTRREGRAARAGIRLDRRARVGEARRLPAVQRHPEEHHLQVEGGRRALRVHSAGGIRRGNQPARTRDRHERAHASTRRAGSSWPTTATAGSRAGTTRCSRARSSSTASRESGSTARTTSCAAPNGDIYFTDPLVRPESAERGSRQGAAVQRRVPALSRRRSSPR